jgi:hypothetical protein
MALDYKVHLQDNLAEQWCRSLPERDLEHEHLVVQVEPRRVTVRKPTKVGMSCRGMSTSMNLNGRRSRMTYRPG